MFLGIEIGGTKLQLGLGPDDGRLRGLWRGTVDVAAGPDGIRRQICAAVPELLAQAGVARGDLRGVGVGFGGPVDDATKTVIVSHQIEGWNDFPLGEWVAEVVGLPAALGNDADVAGLAEALHGAGKGLSPIFYVTIGSGIGGGLVIDGEIYRGVGKGAAEIGHLRFPQADRHLGQSVHPLEYYASGWGIGQQVRQARERGSHMEAMEKLAGERPITAAIVGQAAEQGDAMAQRILEDALQALAEGLCHVIALLCPRRLVLGGGVSLMGETLFFAPLRRMVAERVFRPFEGLTDIVPAALGEEVVVHGAIALARKRTG
jgi:glucokinase